MNKCIAAAVLAATIGLAAVGPDAQAQAFPSKPLRIVIGFPPGGGIDIIARLLGPKLAESMGQPVVVENRPGANGVIATELVAKAPADGHAVFLGTSGNLAMNPVFYPSLPFSMERDLAPVTQLASVSFLVLLNPAVPARNVAALIDYIKSNPGKVNYSSAGNGSTPHLAGELFAQLTGARAVHVPYKGSAPAMADLIAGQVQFTYDAVAIALPHVRSGKIRAIATTGPKRLATMPDVPAVAETVPGFEVVNFYGVVAPAGTPPEAIARWRSELVKAMAIAEIRERMLTLGAEPVGSPPEEFGAFMRAETVKWGKVIREANVKPD